MRTFAPYVRMMKLLILVIVLPACLKFSDARPTSDVPPRSTARFINLNSLPPPPLPPQVEEDVPYPEAQAPDPMPAVAGDEDEDCGGLISLPPGQTAYPRVGTWAMGDFVGSRFSPMLFFNTERDARDCAGSSGMRVMKHTRTGWK